MRINNLVFDGRISALQEFITRHTRVMNCLFLLLYALEQALLVIFCAIYPLQIMFIISLFVILAFLTFGIEKVSLETRNKYLEKELTELKNEREMFIRTMKWFKTASKSIRRSYRKTESLKRSNTYKEQEKEND